MACRCGQGAQLDGKVGLAHGCPMAKVASGLFWSAILAILWMFAGHAWAGTMLGLILVAWVVFAAYAVIILLD